MRFHDRLARQQRWQGLAYYDEPTIVPFPFHSAVPLSSSLPSSAIASLPPSSVISPVINQQNALGLITDIYGLDSVQGPINTLPPEILGEIFLYCLPPRVWKPPTPNIREAPMLLCRVCSYWRELAFSLPMLWSSFAGSYGNVLQAGHVSLIQLWLERSRSQRLFISLDLREPEPLKSCMVRLFLDNIYRWDDVTFNIDDNSAKDLLAIPGGRAHFLDRFGINAAKCSPKAMDEISSIFLSFPNLRRLWWYSDSTPTALLGMSFSSLTHIKLLCPISFNEYVRFIAQCFQIRDVEISEVQPSIVPFTPSIITLPHLSSLNISNCVSELLDFFTLPSLRSLVFGHTRPRDFNSFAARSSCKLETFHLSDLKLTEDELIHYLRMPWLQSLRDLQIISCDVTDRTLAVLHYSEANPKANVLPHLEIFSIISCITTDGVFADMVASRWRPDRVSRDNDSPASLKEVYVSFHWEGKRHNLDNLRLQEFATSGLKIR